METTSLFDFTVDKSKKTVYIKKEFAASRSLVWDAFTKAEMLDQWWAPQPLVSKTKIMDFKVGGRRFYAMMSADGQVLGWSVHKFTAISPKTNFKMYCTFADKDENPELPGSDWDLNFVEKDGTTKVSIVIYNESLERMEKILDGFTQGMKMTLTNLENLLATLSKKV